MQCNLDGDELGDVCYPDIDDDGFDNDVDNCVFLDNPDQGNLDEDVYGDACDCDVDLVDYSIWQNAFSGPRSLE